MDSSYSGFSLDGSMVPRSVQRHIDQRDEPRVDARLQTAVLTLGNREHVVQLVNISPSGAMIIFSLIPHIGTPIKLQLEGREPVDGRVCWVREGRVGVSFVTPLE